MYLGLLLKKQLPIIIVLASLLISEYLPCKIRLWSFKNLKGTDKQIVAQLMTQLTTKIIAEVAVKSLKKEVKKGMGDKLGGLFGKEEEGGSK